MSRKSVQDKSEWRLPSLHAFVGEYGPFKVNGVEAIEHSLIWICNSSVDETMMMGFKPSGGEVSPTENHHDHGHYNHDHDHNHDHSHRAEEEKETESSGKHHKNVDYGRRHPILRLARDAQECLLRRSHYKDDQYQGNGQSSSSSNSRFRSIIVVDLHDMFESYEDYQEAISNEMDHEEVTKGFGKRLVRLFHRLILQNCTLAALGPSLGPAILKVYQALHQIDPDMISELWLIHPELTNKFINTHLAGANTTIYPAKLVVVPPPPTNNSASANKPPSPKGSKKKRQKKKGGRAKSTSMGSRMTILKYYFPQIEEIEIQLSQTKESKNRPQWFSIVDHGKALPTSFSNEASDALLAPVPPATPVVESPFGHDDAMKKLLGMEWMTSLDSMMAMDPNFGGKRLIEDDKQNIEEPEEEEDPMAYDPDYCNEMGKTLFMSEIKVEMSRYSKQYERNCLDVTTELIKMKASTSTSGGNSTTQDLSSIDWAKAERHVGALVLRGNKCILIRSLKREWKGMRLPSIKVQEHLSSIDTAIRAVTEMVEVDADEVVPLPFVSPVTVYGPNGRSILIELHPLYATAPPQFWEDHDETHEHEMEEDDEEEDEGDLYDWYTFPKAMSRLEDASSRAALKTMAANLQQALQAGLVPNKWGGVFGQEDQQQTKASKS